MRCGRSNTNLDTDTEEQFQENLDNALIWLYPQLVLHNHARSENSDIEYPLPGEVVMINKDGEDNTGAQNTPRRTISDLWPLASVHSKQWPSMRRVVTANPEEQGSTGIPVPVPVPVVFGFRFRFLVPVKFCTGTGTGTFFEILEGKNIIKQLWSIHFWSCHVI